MRHRHSEEHKQLRHNSNGGAPNIPVDLGTGVLAAMRTISGIDEIKPRLAMRARLPINYHYTQGDERMRVLLAACHGERKPHIDSDFSFNVPVDIDMMEETTPTFSMSKITEDEAREHGYADANAMRRSLGFKKGEDGIVFSYRLLAPEMPPNDLTFAGDRARMAHAAYEAFRGAKGEKNMFDRNGRPRQSNEKSIKAAREFLGTLSRHAALIAEASITPRLHLEEAELVPFAPPLRHTRRSNGTAHPREVPTEISALPAPEPSALAETKPKRRAAAKPAAAEIPVTYASDFGSRGQYTDAAARSKPAAPRVWSREERRTILQAKSDKRAWRDRVARAAFGVGEDIPPEPAALQQPSQPRVKKSQADAAEAARREHLYEENVPDEGPFGVEDYLSSSRTRNEPTRGTRSR